MRWRSPVRSWRLTVALVLAVLTSLLASGPGDGVWAREGDVVADERLFPETGKKILGHFLHYWTTRGGLPLYGYPISEAMLEVSRTNGRVYLVQYFERARFEYHPELAGTPSEVLLGLLGRQVTEGRERELYFLPLRPITDTPDQRFFPTTSHSIRSARMFKSFWEQHGGLPQFGYPISEEFREINPADGKTYTVQYFERARFEHHPEHVGTAHVVQLGLLGRQVYAGP